MVIFGYSNLDKLSLHSEIMLRMSVAYLATVLPALAAFLNQALLRSVNKPAIKEKI
jgi:hypothetical protein